MINNTDLKEYLNDKMTEHQKTFWMKVHEEDGDNLIWIPSLGIGYYPVKDFVYDDEYFDKYASYEDTEMSNNLNEDRSNFVRKHYGDRFFASEVVDVGVGSGSFCRNFNCSGYDVNPVGIEWLTDNSMFEDIYQRKYPVMTFWDSLEHIENPSEVLNNITEWAFVSCPIYTDFHDVIHSKHFRTDEHFWYWTEQGFIDWMDYHGFNVVDVADFEIQNGRESILSFACRKRKSSTC